MSRELLKDQRQLDQASLDGDQAYSDEQHTRGGHCAQILRK